MSLVQHAGEQWWRCALAKNDAGKTAWGVAIDGSKHVKVGQSFGWAAKSDESNMRSRANSAASTQDKDRAQPESGASATAGDHEGRKTESESAKNGRNTLSRRKKKKPDETSHVSIGVLFLLC